MPPLPVRLLFGIAFIGGAWYVLRLVRRALPFHIARRPDHARALRAEAVIVDVLAVLMALTGLAFMFA